MLCIKKNGCRYLLETQNTRRPLFVIGANPSTADESTDDPTVRKTKCQNNFRAISKRNEVCLHQKNEKGNPVHPLYHKKDSRLVSIFEIL